MTAEITAAEKKKSIQGMWVFIGSELLLFGGLFLSLTVFRFINMNAFIQGTNHMNLSLGTLNTGILLTSSWTLAVAIEKARSKKINFVLFATTIALGLLFLIIKGTEYYQHIHDGFFPQKGSPLPLFFFLYFFMTGLHALHVLIGLAFIGWVVKVLKNSSQPQRHEALLENAGLYWHFVDIIWVFLFPALYLIGRSSV